MKSCLMLCAGLLMLAGCAPLNQESYDTLMSLPPKVNTLEQKLAAIESPAKQAATPGRKQQSAKPKAEALRDRMQRTLAQQDVRVQATDARTVHITMQHHILFPSGSATLRDSGIKFLQKFARVAENLPADARVRIVGHSDNRQLSWQTRQKFKDNMALSKARADAVKAWLIKHSRIPPAILSSEGRGASQPIGNNGTREGRALNRRIEIFVENI